MTNTPSGSRMPRRTTQTTDLTLAVGQHEQRADRTHDDTVTVRNIEVSHIDLPHRNARGLRPRPKLSDHRRARLETVYHNTGLHERDRKTPSANAEIKYRTMPTRRDSDRRRHASSVGKATRVDAVVYIGMSLAVTSRVVSGGQHHFAKSKEATDTTAGSPTTSARGATRIATAGRGR